jgi:hypothetical protein
MSNLEDLAKIQQALGSLQSNNPIDELTANKLLKEANISSAINSADLIRIGKTQSDISQVLGGESLDFGSITRLSDCIKNIDDIIIDRLTKKLTSLLLQNSTVSAALATATNVMAVINTVNGYIAFVQSLLDKSFLELLILAKDAGLLERSELFRQIQEKYGSTINNLNEILANIDNLNICTMMGLGGGPVPSGVKNMKPEALPDFGSFIKVDTASLEKKQKYEDVISRIGFEITNVIDFVPNQLAGVLNRAPQTPPAVNDALSHLQNFSRAVINRYGVASDDEVTKLRALFNNEIDRKINEYAYEWSPETREFYKQKAQEALSIAETEHKTLRDWNLKKNSNYSVGQRVSSGITLYGDPEWDFTTFLDLAPSEREKRPDLVAKYGSRLTRGLASLAKQGYKPGTLKLSDTSNGAYGKLTSGYSCATARWPGGTKLQLRNPSGSIYDPAGLNPSGIVTVVDYGPVSQKTWDRLDVYIEKANDAEKYQNSNTSNVEVYLVELGTKISAKYTKAQNMFA